MQLYKPDSTEQYEILRQYAQSWAERLEIRDYIDTLHDAISSILQNINGKSVPLSYVKRRIRCRLYNVKKAAWTRKVDVVDPEIIDRIKQEKICQHHQRHIANA